MKKTILLMTVAFLGTQAMGQISSGTLFGTAGLSFESMGNTTTTTIGSTTTTDEYPKASGFGLDLGAGYFLTDNLAAGINFGFGSANLNYSDTTSDKFSMWTAGLFGRYYMSMSDNFYFFGNLGIGFGGGSSESTSGNTTTEGPKMSMLGFGLQPGFAFFPTERLSFDVMWGNIGWMSETSTMETGGVKVEDKVSTLNFNLDLTTISFGVSYYFGN